MPKLEVIRGKRKQILYFLGWNADQSCIYAQDSSGNDRVLPINLPSLTDLLDMTSQPARLRYKKSPFPDTLPTRIQPVRLIAPPCRACEDYNPKTLTYDASKPMPIPEEWEIDYGVYWFPDDDDKVLISEEFSAYQAKEKSRFEAENNPEPSKYKTLDLNDTAQWIWDLPVQVAIIRNCGGIRDKVLHDAWYEETGFDPVEMKSERFNFRESLEQMLVEPEQLNKLPEPQWKRLHARIKYIAHFEDDTICYLSDIKKTYNPLECTDIQSIEIIKDSKIVSYSLKETCEKLGRGENAVRRYMKRLGIDREQIADVQIGKMMELRDKISKRPDLGKKNRRKY